MKINKLRTENKELQSNIESCRNQTIDIKRRVDELQSGFSNSYNVDLSVRVMELEDYTRKKPCISGTVEQAGETSEQLLEKFRSVVT